MSFRKVEEEFGRWFEDSGLAGIFNALIVIGAIGFVIDLILRQI